MLERPDVVQTLLNPFSTQVSNVGLRLGTVFLISATALFGLYASTVYMMGDGRGASKEEALRALRFRSWIATATSSFVLTIASLPFVYDFFANGMDVALINRRDEFAQGLVAFFVAYLVVDCTLGWFCYRSQFNVLTGWFHHTGYTCLLFVIMRTNCCHVFLLAAIMESPTLVLSVGMMFPAARNDSLFTALFFFTRIALHAVFICLYSSPYGRLNGARLYDATGEPIQSLVPIIGLCMAAPLHIIWFTNSVKGNLKRRRIAQRALVEQTSAFESTFRTDVVQVDDIVHESGVTKEQAAPRVPYLNLHRPRFVSLASFYLPSAPPFRRPFLSARRAVNGRRHRSASEIAQSLEKDVRDFFERNVKLAREWKLVNDLEEYRQQFPKDWQSLVEANINYTTFWDNSGTDQLEEDVIKALDVRFGTEQSIRRLRARAGQGGEGLKRFGGDLRRRVGEAVMAL